MAQGGTGWHRAAQGAQLPKNNQPLPSITSLPIPPTTPPSPHPPLPIPLPHLPLFPTPSLLTHLYSHSPLYSPPSLPSLSFPSLPFPSLPFPQPLSPHGPCTANTPPLPSASLSRRLLFPLPLAFSSPPPLPSLPLPLTLSSSLLPLPSLPPAPHLVVPNIKQQFQQH
ncbi:unnamed protein product [Closterium sp. NIES-65]|nr:unnamed protein product [Closterium sp. NIES-65]